MDPFIRILSEEFLEKSKQAGAMWSAYSKYPSMITVQISEWKESELEPQENGQRVQKSVKELTLRKI